MLWSFPGNGWLAPLGCVFPGKVRLPAGRADQGTQVGPALTGSVAEAPHPPAPTGVRLCVRPCLQLGGASGPGKDWACSPVSSFLCFLRRQAPLEGLKWRMARRESDGHGHTWPRHGPGCRERHRPQGERRAPLGTTYQATLPLPVRAGRAGTLPLSLAPRRLQGLDAGVQEAVPQRRERHTAGEPGCQPAQERHTAGLRPPGGRPHLAPHPPGTFSQRQLWGRQGGRLGTTLATRGAPRSVLEAPPVPVTGAPGGSGHAPALRQQQPLVHTRAGPAAGPAAVPLAALCARWEEVAAQAQA